jgi:RNA polymerase sigma-70 factor, ECF subfamily
MDEPTRQEQDAADIRRVLGGEVDAFEGIVRRWQGPLVNLAWRYVRERGRAEEMAQEAFVKIWRNLSRYRQDAPFSTWLFAVASNHYRSSLRRAGPPTLPLDEAAERAKSAPALPDPVDRDRDRVLREAVARLPPRYRDALIHYYFHEMDLRQAAGALGVPEGTLKARLHRGREMLRVKLGGLLSPRTAAGEA